nr:GNAT family N-acetyltransferase [Marinobacterium sedimentorum]
MSGCGWPPEAIAEFLRQQFQLQLNYYQEHFPDGEFWLIEQEGRAIGRLYLSWGKTTLQLIDIALLPELRGTGLGSRLLNEVLARTDASGLAVTLHVESQNPAVRLYQRLGFDIVADKDVYLEMHRPPRSVTTDQVTDKALPRIRLDQNQQPRHISTERTVTRSD